MSVKVHIHQSMRHLVGDQEVVEVVGSTVGECLNNLVGKYPEIRPKIFDKKGGLINFIDIFVNEESSVPEELKKKVEDGDELTIALILCGG